MRKIIIKKLEFRILLEAIGSLNILSIQTCNIELFSLHSIEPGFNIKSLELHDVKMRLKTFGDIISSCIDIECLTVINCEMIDPFLQSYFERSNRPLRLKKLHLRNDSYEKQSNIYKELIQMLLQHSKNTLKSVSFNQLVVEPILFLKFFTECNQLEEIQLEIKLSHENYCIRKNLSIVKLELKGQIKLNEGKKILLSCPNLKYVRVDISEDPKELIELLKDMKKIEFMYIYNVDTLIGETFQRITRYCSNLYFRSNMLEAEEQNSTSEIFLPRGRPNSIWSIKTLEHHQGTFDDCYDVDGRSSCLKAKFVELYELCIENKARDPFIEGLVFKNFILWNSSLNSLDVLKIINLPITDLKILRHINCKKLTIVGDYSDRDYLINWDFKQSAHELYLTKFILQKEIRLIPLVNCFPQLRVLKLCHIEDAAIALRILKTHVNLNEITLPQIVA